MPGYEAPKPMIEWLLGPVAGAAAGLFTAGRKAGQLAEHARRLDALEASSRTEAASINAKIEAVRAELRGDMKELRVELRDDFSELKDMVRRIGMPPV
jgi:gas vesicle protein